MELCVVQQTSFQVVYVYVDLSCPIDATTQTIARMRASSATRQRRRSQLATSVCMPTRAI